MNLNKEEEIISINAQNHKVATIQKYIKCFMISVAAKNTENIYEEFNLHNPAALVACDLDMSGGYKNYKDFLEKMNIISLVKRGGRKFVKNKMINIASTYKINFYKLITTIVMLNKNGIQTPISGINSLLQCQTDVSEFKSFINCYDSEHFNFLAYNLSEEEIEQFNKQFSIKGKRLYDSVDDNGEVRYQKSNLPLLSQASDNIPNILNNNSQKPVAGHNANRYTF